MPRQRCAQHRPAALSLLQNKARNIAVETLEVFGPLARLLGLYTIKEELEELAFK